MSFKKWVGSTGTQILLLLLVFSLAEIGILFWQNGKLKSSIETLQEQVLALQGAQPLSVGDSVPDLAALNLDESQRSVALDDKKLLFFFREDCPACKVNFKNWADLEEKVGVENVLYVSVLPVEQTKDYAISRRIADRTVVARNESILQEYKIARIPQTILIAGNRVAAIEVGVLDGDKKERFLTIWNASLASLRP